MLSAFLSPRCHANAAKRKVLPESSRARVARECYPRECCPDYWHGCPIRVCRRPLPQTSTVTRARCNGGAHIYCMGEPRTARERHARQLYAACGTKDASESVNIKRQPTFSQCATVLQSVKPFSISAFVFAILWPSRTGNVKFSSASGFVLSRISVLLHCTSATAQKPTSRLTTLTS
jgi:hypothetical protein